MVKGTTQRTTKTVGVAVALLLAAVGFEIPAFAFTQSGAGLDVIGNAIPMGHEWITRLALLELIGGDPVIKADPDDPRKKWTMGKAKHTALDATAMLHVQAIKAYPAHDDRYQSGFRAGLDAIVGERWVDIAGFNVTNSLSGKFNCFDAVAQEPAEIQYDHFMRRYDDRGAAGGVHAAKESQARFVEHFVNAAMAPRTVMKVWDGGGYASAIEVDRRFFLFGRALHLFEDSFSPEHAVRIADDNYQRVRQVKSYLCADGSEQHSHSVPAVLDYTGADVIWRTASKNDSGWASYKPSNMKTVALVAVEATKDAWAAFIRTLAIPLEERQRKAQQEAQKLVDNWLSIDTQEADAWYNNDAHRIDAYVLATGETGKGQSVAACMNGLGEKSGSQVAKVQELERAQRICLFNLEVEPGYGDLFDPFLHMPFNWRWKLAGGAWAEPPPAWQIPKLPADTGSRVLIKNLKTGWYLSAPDGVAHNQWIYSRKGGSPILEFIQVGPAGNAAYRLARSSLFLSYNNTTGAVKLWDSPDGAWYAQEVAGQHLAIRHLISGAYMYTRGDSPYITRHGDPGDSTGQWMFDKSWAP